MECRALAPAHLESYVVFSYPPVRGLQSGGEQARHSGVDWRVPSLIFSSIMSSRYAIKLLMLCLTPAAHCFVVPLHSAPGSHHATWAHCRHATARRHQVNVLSLSGEKVNKFRLGAGAGQARVDNNAKQRNPWHPFDKLLQLTLPDLPLIVLAFAALSLAAAGDALLPKLQGEALNAALNLVSADAVWTGSDLQQPLSSLAATGLVTAVFTGIRGSLFWLCGARLVARLRLTLFEALLRQPQAFFDEHSSGSLSSRLATDCVKLGDVLSLNMNIVLRQLLQSCIGMSIVLHINVSLAGLVLCGLAFRSLLTTIYARASRALAEAQQNALAASSEVAEQGLSLIHMVRAHGSESVEAARYRSKLGQLLGLQTRQGLLYGASRVADGGLNAVLLATVMPLFLL